ncbi:Hypothetical_protein [Hexamita inflata]|uniref:Hypothetical_protein n=1 Tax=Hexamita inflata TaxID=28002 RepID=A0AA86U035_9EUKA|nr:Hypothetical protein HINF_LOCUS22696 [Hexamita inflata]
MSLPPLTMVVVLCACETLAFAGWESTKAIPCVVVILVFVANFFLVLSTSSSIAFDYHSREDYRQQIFATLLPTFVLQNVLVVYLVLAIQQLNGGTLWISVSLVEGLWAFVWVLAIGVGVLQAKTQFTHLYNMHLT